MFRSLDLVDLNTIEDDTLLQAPWAALLQMVMKHVYDSDIAPLIQTLLDQKVLQWILNQQGPHSPYLKTILYYLYNTAEIKDKDTLVAQINQADTTLGALNMTIAEQWRQEGMQAGMQIGKQAGIELGMKKGATQEKIHIAKKLLARQLSVEEISELIHLSREEIISLKKDTDPNEVKMPVNYRIYNPADNQSKNDDFLEMLDEVLKRGLRPSFVTGDAWYCSLKKLKPIRKHGLNSLLGVDGNRLILLEKGSYQQAQLLADYPDGGGGLS